MAGQLESLYFWIVSKAPGSLPTLTSLTGEVLAHHSSKDREFLTFLQPFEKALHNNAEISLDGIYDLAFSYLANAELNPHIKRTKAQTLFANFLNADPEAAMSWYKNHNELAKKLSPGIAALVAVYQEEQETKNRSAKVVKRKEEIQALLQFEEQVAGILPLFQNAVGDVSEFAALLLVALEKGVTTEQIINSDILKQFIIYHFPHSGPEDNEITQLKSVLEEFPHTADLVGHLQESFAQYSSSPVAEKKNEPPISFTISAENMTNLATLFKESFLMGASLQAAFTADDELRQWLANYLEQMPPADLAAFINLIGKNDKIDGKKSLLKLLAHSLSEEAVKHLLSRHEGAVFYLASYRRDIYEAVNNLDSLKNYLSALKNSGSSIYDTIPRLSSILSNINNQDAKSLLFKEILDILLENLSLDSQNPLVNDYTLMSIIRGEAKNQQHLLALKTEVLIKDWNEAFNQKLAEKNYGAIKELWARHNPLFSFLHQLGPKTDFPENKYQLYALLVKKLAKQSGFQLSDFLAAVCSSEEPSERAIEKERALIEILAAVDNKSIRQSAIKLLEKTPRTNGLWSKHIYAQGVSVLNLAVQYGNLGLIELFFSPHHSKIYAPNTTKEVNQILELAVDENQWDIAKFLCSLTSANKPKGKNISWVLMNAASLGKLEMVKFLCEFTSDNKPNEKAVDKALKFAAEKGHLDIVKLICDLNTTHKPNSKAVGKAAQAAAQKEQWHIVQYLCSLITTNKPSKIVVADILKEAAKAGQLNVVKTICQLKSDNKPLSPDINEALIAAVQAGHLDIVKLFCSLALDQRPGREAIENALTVAVVQRQWSIVELICNLPEENKPGKWAVENALTVAVEQRQWPIVELICNFTGESKPGRGSVENALTVAVEQRQWSIVELICNLPGENRPNKRAVENALMMKWVCFPTTNNKPSAGAVGEALIEAARVKSWDTVHLICKLTTDNKPNAQAVREALIQAAREKAWDTVQFLCELTTDNKPDADALDEALAIATMHKHLPTMRLIAALPSANKPNGFIGALNYTIQTGNMEDFKFFYNVIVNKKIIVTNALEELFLQPNLPLEIVKFLCEQTMQGKSDLGVEALHSKSKLLKDANNGELTEILSDAIKIKTLHDCIATLKEYGEDLKQQRTGFKKGEYAVNQAERLTQLTNEYGKYWRQNPSDEGRLQSIRAEFKETLKESYENMKEHRKSWKPILANIAIAATGIGLFLLLGQFIKTGNAFFSQTTRQSKIKSVEKMFNEIDDHSYRKRN